MSQRGFWLVCGVLGLAAVAAVVWMLRDEVDLRERQRPHITRPLVFDGPVQPESVGPIRVRFDCPGQAGAVTIKVFYVGIATEAGRPYANETNEIFLDTVYAAGRVGEVGEIPAASFDRRARSMIRDGQIDAEIYVSGAEDLSGWRRVGPDAMADVIAIPCETPR